MGSCWCFGAKGAHQLHQITVCLRCFGPQRLTDTPPATAAQSTPPLGLPKLQRIALLSSVTRIRITSSIGFKHGTAHSHGLCIKPCSTNNNWTAALFALPLP